MARLSAHTPPASARPYYPNAEWMIAYTTGEQLLPTTTAFAWSTAETQALFYPPRQVSPLHRGYHSDAPGPMYSTIPHAWPLDIAAVSHPEDARPESLGVNPMSGSCDPLSTLLPHTSWTPPHHQRFVVGNGCEASPSLSAYSPKSDSSALQSTGVRSGYYRRTAGSPVIKVEEPLGLTTPDKQLLPDGPVFVQSLFGDLGTLGIQSPSFGAVQCKISRSPSVGAFLESTTLDSKPLMETLPPASCNGSSSGSEDDETAHERKKRGYTSVENAKYHCEQCGKLFQRSYNLKAHMATHDPLRSHPHPCQHTDCERTFIRRTDLVRHEQSVRFSFRSQTRE